MNARIKKLKEQATSYTWNGNDVTEELDEQKFAQLIVKEAGALLMSPEFIGRSDLDWSMVLNEHFGVEL